MYLIDKWDVFCAESKDNDIDIDQISIDERNKRFVLDVGGSELLTDELEEMIPEGSTCVSRFIFDLVLNGVKAKRFTELVGKNK